MSGACGATRAVSVGGDLLANGTVSQSGIPSGGKIKQIRADTITLQFIMCNGKRGISVGDGGIIGIGSRKPITIYEDGTTDNKMTIIRSVIGDDGVVGEAHADAKVMLKSLRRALGEKSPKLKFVDLADKLLDQYAAPALERAKHPRPSGNPPE